MVEPHARLERRAAVARLLADRGDLLVVAGLGSPAYDLHAAGDRPDNFYLWGAMGGAAMMGLGLAQARPDRPVLVLTGDGEQLMGLGGLATIGTARPSNLSIVVLDNGRYAETGMQESHTGRGLDLAAVARSCGFVETGVATALEGVDEVRAKLRAPATGPRLFVLRIAATSPPRSLPARDAVHLKNRFRASLGLDVN